MFVPLILKHENYDYHDLYWVSQKKLALTNVVSSNKLVLSKNFVFKYLHSCAIAGKKKKKKKGGKKKKKQVNAMTKFCSYDSKPKLWWPKLVCAINCSTKNLQMFILMFEVTNIKTDLWNSLPYFGNRSEIYRPRPEFKWQNFIQNTFCVVPYIHLYFAGPAICGHLVFENHMM